MIAAEARAAVFNTVRRDVPERIEAFLPVDIEPYYFAFRLYPNRMSA
jgi:hypothetical protein